MSHVHHVQPFPRGMLIAAGILVSAAIGFAGLARLTDVGATRMSTDGRTEVVLLRFADLADGGITVAREPGGAELRRYTPGEAGFVRVVVRTLAQKRMAAHASAEAPFKLIQLDNGQLLLEDPASGANVLLKAFGPGNAAMFQELLEKGRRPS